MPSPSTAMKQALFAAWLPACYHCRAAAFSLSVEHAQALLSVLFPRPQPLEFASSAARSGGLGLDHDGSGNPSLYDDQIWAIAASIWTVLRGVDGVDLCGPASWRLFPWGLRPDRGFQQFSRSSPIVEATLFDISRIGLMEARGFGWQSSRIKKAYHGFEPMQFLKMKKWSDMLDLQVPPISETSSVQ